MVAIIVGCIVIVLLIVIITILLIKRRRNRALTQVQVNIQLNEVNEEGKPEPTNTPIYDNSTMGNVTDAGAYKSVSDNSVSQVSI